MKVLAISHGLWYSGAQVSTLEFLEMLSQKVDIRIITCKNGNREFINNLKLVGPVYEVPCRKDLGYPAMHVEEVKPLVREIDLVWLTDVEFLAAPRIKRIRRDVPVVAHLHSYALICPWWGALYGFRGVCTERCSAWRNTRCKQGINLELAKVGLLSESRASLYWLLDFAKGPVDFAKWRLLMKNVVRSIDGFIAVSNNLWDIHLKHLPELKGKPHVVVYNPALTPFKYVNVNDDEPYGDYVLYASGPNLVKGPHILLDAWKMIEKEVSGVELVMTGCKGTWVEGRVKSLGVGNVRCLGRVPEQQYYELMYRARALVLPSLWPEPFSLVPLEANRLGVPAIISDRNGVREVFTDGVNGRIWPCCRAEALAEVIRDVVTRSWKREAIRRSIDNILDPVTISNKIIEFFTHVASIAK